MDWRILVFYSEPEARDTFTYIRQSMLKLKRHSGFHDLYANVNINYRRPIKVYYRINFVLLDIPELI
jgi:hypothetical protein